MVGAFVGMVDSPRNNEDPTRVRIDLTFGDSLPNLFRRIGESLSTRTSLHWAHPELEPYFPCPVRRSGCNAAAVSTTRR
jgi:hypothetical protein